MTTLSTEAREAAATPRWPARFKPKRDTLLGAGTIVALLVIWQLVYFFELMPRWAFPSPVQVVAAFYELTLNGELPVNAGYSVLRQFTGVILAAAFGIPVGLALGASPQNARRLKPRSSRCADAAFAMAASSVSTQGMDGMKRPALTSTTGLRLRTTARAISFVSTRTIRPSLTPC